MYVINIHIIDIDNLVYISSIFFAILTILITFMLITCFTSEIRDTASDVIPLISQLFPGMINTGQRFVLMLLQRQALRFADDLDGKQSVSEWDRDPSAFARKIRPLISGS